MHVTHLERNLAHTTKKDKLPKISCCDRSISECKPASGPPKARLFLRRDDLTQVPSSGLADTRKMVQHCKATMFGHGRVCFLLILPRRNLFLMGTVLHLLRSCIAGRGLWGKPFNRENFPDGNTLVAALNSLKVRCSRVITASKPDGAPGITCHLHKLLPKKMHLSVPLLSAPLQLDASGYSWECHEDVVSHGRPSSHLPI